MKKQKWILQMEKVMHEMQQLEKVFGEEHCEIFASTAIKSVINYWNVLNRQKMHKKQNQTT